MANKGRQYIDYNNLKRRAPLHYEARADNARFTAYLLHRGCAEEGDAAKSIGYSGTAFIARDEGFRREAAIAIELILKAVIAARIEVGLAGNDVQSVRETHDVLALWQEAGLPGLGNRDERILLRVRTVLTWAGRYAAPKYDDLYEEDLELDERLSGPKTGLFSPALGLSWEDVDRLYKIALAGFARAMRWYEDHTAS